MAKCSRCDFLKWIKNAGVAASAIVIGLLNGNEKKAEDEIERDLNGFPVVWLSADASADDFELAENLIITIKNDKKMDITLPSTMKLEWIDRGLNNGERKETRWD